MADGAQAKVNDRSGAVSKMAADWPMTEALMAGTRAMRLAKDALLPKWPNEEQKSYEARLATATLFPAFRRTVSVMAGKPFAKQCVLSDDTPVEIAGTPATDTAPEVEGWADDIDREGVSLHAFAAEMMAECLAHGMAGILVDAPKPPETGRPVRTVADEKAAGVRPYFVRVMHNQLLGWRVAQVDGARKLTQLRILECITEPDGSFGEKEVQQVRVLEPGKWTTYREVQTTGGQKEWIVAETGTTSLSYIPFVPLYGWRDGFMCGRSPLLDLAFLNVKHWQSQSDQDTILHVARVPILFAKGFGDSDEITVGAASAVKASNVDADLSFVEHTGRAIEAGAASLDDLEEQMIQAGAELLVKKPGDRSATESANDAEANKSDLQRIVETFEDSLDAALAMLADLGGLRTGGHVSLYKDFGATTLSAATAQLVTSWQQSGLIRKVTAVRELQRRGELSADIDPDEEVQEAADEAPLGLITAGPGTANDKTGQEPEPEAA